MKILVTGGAGFIGSHIVEHFQHRAEVRVLDNLHTGSRSNLNGLKCKFIRASILDRTAVRKALNDVDFVFHLAALISVPESMRKPIEYSEINTNGTLLLLEEAARAGVQKFIFSSSAAIYGDSPVTPKTESMKPEPKSPYAVTKLDGEYYCKMFAESGQLKTSCLRYFNVFGPRQFPGSQYAAAVPIFIDRAFKNEPITIHGDGEQTRDFIFVKDVAVANAYFATESGQTGIFNVAYGKRTTINKLATTIKSLAGSESKIRHLAEREGDVKHSKADVKKLQLAGFKPANNFMSGLKATVEFFKGRLETDRGKRTLVQ